MTNDNERTKARDGRFLTEEISFSEIFTPEDFLDIHTDIAKAAEDFVTREIMSRGEEVEINDYERSRELLRKTGELGYLGVDIAEEYGGMAMDKISSAIVSEELGYGAGSFVVTESNHTGIGTLPLALFGTEEQKKKYLPGLISGKTVGCFGLTEQQGGSDALNPRTTATLSNDGKYYLLNGNKQFITNSGFADIIFVYAKVDGKFFTAFIVEQKWDGVSLGEEEEKMGYHGTSTRAYNFSNVKVPVENVLGEIGKGHVVALNALNLGRYKIGATCTGSAKRALFEATRYSKQRVLFGRPICDFGAIKSKISEMAIRIYALESMVYRTGWLIQSEIERLRGSFENEGILMSQALEKHIIECSVNKVYGSETESYVVDEELQIFGGYGYIKGSHPELAYRNARINRIWEGTNEINRIIIANAAIYVLSSTGLELSHVLHSVTEELEGSTPIHSDSPATLQAQNELIRIAKKVTLLVSSALMKRYEDAIKKEQELLLLISNMIIEIYAMESVLLRSEKMLKGKNSQRASVPVKMTKVFFHDSLQRVRFFAETALEVAEEGEEALDGHLSAIRRLMVPPAINTVTWRKDIADMMIQRGRYDF